MQNDLFGFAPSTCPRRGPSDEESRAACAPPTLNSAIPRVSGRRAAAKGVGNERGLRPRSPWDLLANADSPEVVSEGPVTFDDGMEGYGYVLDLTAETVPARPSLRGGPRLAPVSSLRRVRSRPTSTRAPSDQFEAIVEEPPLPSTAAPFGARLDRSLVMQSRPRRRRSIRTSSEDIGSYRFAAQIFSGLVSLDRDLRVVPAMAESWDISDDGLVYDFHLHPDAVFHSGKRVTPGGREVVVRAGRRSGDGLARRRACTSATSRGSKRGSTARPTKYRASRSSMRTRCASRSPTPCPTSSRR